MSEHADLNELLPFYLTGSLDESRRRSVRRHLAACQECRDDLELWKAVAGEVRLAGRGAVLPPHLPDQVLERLRRDKAGRQKETGAQPSPLGAALARSIQLLRAQVPLVRREIWPASALVVAIGYLAALIAGDAAVIHALAPLVAASGLAVIYGPENDPGLELALATPTSPRQILLARMALVFGYDLVLAMLASLALPLFLPQVAPASLILGWLGPMTFLSAAALALSLRIGAGNAASLAYLAWLAQFVTRGMSLSPGLVSLDFPAARLALQVYSRFWSEPAALLALSALLSCAALWYVGRQEAGRSHVLIQG